MTERQRDDTRSGILNAIRDSGQVVRSDPAAIGEAAADLLSGIEEARPPLLSEDVVEAFKLRFENDLVVGTTCEQVNGIGELPGAVRRYLEQYGLPPAVMVQPCGELLALDWDGIETNADVERDNTVGVCLAEYGIAETGSVVVHSGADMPILLNFLPLHMLVAVPRSNILAYLDDYAGIAAQLAAESRTPRNMCLITGASGTTDIEGVLVKGAHGPKFLHIVMIAD